MSSPIGIILASHGDLAAGALSALEMIVGGVQEVQTVCVTLEMSTEAVEEEFRRCMDKLTHCGHILICVDIRSGTPCNVASRFYLTRDDVSILAGFNLAVLAEIVNRVASGEADVSAILREVKEVFPQTLSTFVKGDGKNGN